MPFEYTVIPAPTRGEKSKEAKTPGARYAVALTAELNRMARSGWDYVRADVLPSEERSGLTGRSTVYHNLLVFRREVPASVAEPAMPHPQPEDPAAASTAQEPEPTPDLPRTAAPQRDDTQARLPSASIPAAVDAAPPAPRVAPGQD